MIWCAWEAMYKVECEVSELRAAVKVLEDELVENNVVELEGQVEELFDSTNLLTNVAVHFPFVRLLLAAMEHEHIV